MSETTEAAEAVSGPAEEFEREPVPRRSLLGFRSFIGMCRNSRPLQLPHRHGQTDRRNQPVTVLLADCWPLPGGDLFDQGEAAGVFRSQS